MLIGVEQRQVRVISCVGPDLHAAVAQLLRLLPGREFAWRLRTHSQRRTQRGEHVGALIERLYVDLEASLYGDLIDAVDGNFRVPDGPGLGVEPDADVIESYRIRDA